MKRRLLVIQRIYFYVLAFNEVERTKKNFYFFSSCCIFPISIVSNFRQKLFKKFVLQMLYEECSETNDG